MKLHTALLLFCTLCFHAQHAFPQEESDFRLSVSYLDQPLKKILLEIEQKYNVKFSYVDQVVANRYVTVSVRNKPLSQVLAAIFLGTNLSFEIFDETDVAIFRKQVSESYGIVGRVVEAHSGAAIPFANVLIPTLRTGDAADSSGYFKIERLPPDTYPLEVHVIGYERFSKRVALSQDINLTIRLAIQAVELEAVEITPGIIRIAAGDPVAHILSPEEIISSPNFTRDIYRSLQVLPSVSNTDFSSKPHIKGGNPDETAVIVDNLQLYEPFHLEDIDGLFSVINTDMIKKVKLVTGGFSAKYTDKMSGILEINTVDAANDPSFIFSIDLLNASLSAANRLSANLNHFMSIRRGHLDVFISSLPNSGSDRPNFPESKLEPNYWDFWNKLEYRISPKHRVSINLLHSIDNLLIQDEAVFQPEFIDSFRRNSYGWLNWHWLINEELYSVTTAGYQSLFKDAEFNLISNFGDRLNRDKNDITIFTLKQKTFWQPWSNHALEFGLELNRFRSDYFYDDIKLNVFRTTSAAAVIDTVLVDSEFSGFTFSAYLQNTWSITEGLDLLAGARLSGQNYTDRLQLAPRNALRYQLTANSHLKLAYGWYYQPDNFHRLKTPQGQSLPARVPEKSIHYIGSLSHFWDRSEFNLDIYFKDYTSLNDDFRLDLYARSNQSVIDVPFDTRSGAAHGFDLFLRSKYGSNNLFSIAYSFSKNTIKNQLGLTTARNFDRRHSLTINSILKIGESFTIGALWRFHSGDPYTPFTFGVLGDSTFFNSYLFYRTGPKNSARLNAFHSLDLKIEKQWRLGAVDIMTYLSFGNLYARDNLRKFDIGYFAPEDQVLFLGRDTELFLPRYVSPGISVRF